MNLPNEINNLKRPPQSGEAELSLLGALLIDNNAWESIVDIVTENDFYNLENKLIFKSINDLLVKNKPADIVTVYDQLKNAARIEEIGGLNYLNELVNSTPSSANIKRYAEIVRDKSLLRSLITSSNKIIEKCIATEGAEASEILDSAESEIFAIAEHNNKKDQGFVSISPIVSGVVERIDALYKKNDPSDITGTGTGFIDLDKMTSGFQPGDLIIIAGRPSMGKTAFASNIAEHIAIRQGLPVGIFSLEMSSSQLALRMLGSYGKINQQKLRTGKLSDQDWSDLAEVVQKVSESPLHIDETGAISPLEIRARARRLHRVYGKLELIIVDYLQLMSTGSSNENRATEISEISRSLKSLAKELNVPVIALSQLNRSLEQRPNKRPIMSDLRESGAIEQDADLILFIYRDEVYNPDTVDKNKAEIIVAKQRNGPIGSINLTFQGLYTKFSNYAPEIINY